MCQENNLFIFCTCQEEKKESVEDTDFLKNYTWVLTKLIGLKKSLVRGKIVPPKKDLGNDLTIENILRQLNNNRESFDFEYCPSEKDCLTICVLCGNGPNKHFKVLYKNENWIEGRNSPFRSIANEIARGKILKK